MVRFAAQMEQTGKSRAIGRGFVRVEPAGNTLVAYAAKEGTVADDGDGTHSPFATALLKRLPEPGLEITSCSARSATTCWPRRDTARNRSSTARSVATPPS
jgi:uncharacterized caspase-like protein